MCVTGGGDVLLFYHVFVNVLLFLSFVVLLNVCYLLHVIW